MRRRLFVAVWLAGTLGATLLAWAAVRQVTDEVGPRGPLPLPDTALAAAEPSEVATEAAAPATARPRPRPRPAAPADAEGDAADADADTGPDADGDGAVAAETGGTPAAEPDEPEPQEQEPAAPVRTESYRVTGGTVTVRYSGGQTRLVQASPATGFTAEVNSSGPSTVDVRFRSDDHESRVRAEWRNGRPDVRREEQER